MAAKNKDLAEKVAEIVGFGAVTKLGVGLSKEEIKDIASYCESRGGDKKYISSVLRGRGRPFAIDDPTFKDHCYICRALVNYCCC